MTSNLNSFDGQTVLIVGAASGIGRATATLIQSRGGKVIIVDVDIS